MNLCRIRCAPGVIDAGRKLTLIAVALVAIQPAAAEVKFVPFASAGVETNSNVFDLPANGNYGISNPRDTISQYVLGLDTTGTWGQNSLNINAQGSRFNFNHFDSLSHYEYSADGTLNWHLGEITNTIFTYSQSRALANFADTLTTQLELNTTQTGEARFQFLLTPEWRLDLAPKLHQMDTPLPGYPDFRLKETWGEAAINYLGITNLTAGVQFDYTDGKYSGINSATRYHQDATALAAVYKVTTKSDFTANIGYTSRNTSLNPDGSLGVSLDPQAAAAQGLTGQASTVTGNLGYDLQFTPKTRMTLQVFRNIDSYVAGANSQIGTGGAALLEWSPDFRFTFSLNYREEHDKIDGNILIADFTNRSDRFRTGGLQVKYFIQPWLTLRLFGSREQRSSNYAAAAYSANIVGIELAGRLQQ